MDKNDVVELFETVTALARPFALPIIVNRDIKMDIPKVNLKKEEPPMIPLKIPKYEPLELYKPLFPVSAIGLDSKIDNSTITYLRLNEKHEVDGILEIPESVIYEPKEGLFGEE